MTDTEAQININGKELAEAAMIEQKRLAAQQHADLQAEYTVLCNNLWPVLTGASAPAAIAALLAVAGSIVTRLTDDPEKAAKVYSSYVHDTLAFFPEAIRQNKESGVYDAGSKG